jgi:hypothetical protein
MKHIQCLQIIVHLINGDKIVGIKRSRKEIQRLARKDGIELSDETIDAQYKQMIDLIEELGDGLSKLMVVNEHGNDVVVNHNHVTHIEVKITDN